MEKRNNSLITQINLTLQLQKLEKVKINLLRAYAEALIQVEYSLNETFDKINAWGKLYKKIQLDLTSEK